MGKKKKKKKKNHSHPPGIPRAHASRAGLTRARCRTYLLGPSHHMSWRSSSSHTARSSSPVTTSAASSHISRIAVVSGSAPSISSIRPPRNDVDTRPRRSSTAISACSTRAPGRASDSVSSDPARASTSASPGAAASEPSAPPAASDASPPASPAALALAAGARSRRGSHARSTMPAARYPSRSAGTSPPGPAA
jgi:hypothetical protein